MGGREQNSASEKKWFFFFIVLIGKIMTIECITMPQTTTRFTVFFFFKPSIRLSSLLWIHSFLLLLFLQVITNAARLYTGPTTGISMHLHTKNKRERELTMVNKCTKTIFFFFYPRLKTLTWHPLSGNEMIKYCYCKTRPLKIRIGCSRDAPEQDTSLVESPAIGTNGGAL